MFLAPHGNRNKFIAVCTALTCFSNFQDAYQRAYLNTAYASFKVFINESYISRNVTDGLSDYQYSWIWTSILNVWTLGYLVGSFLSPIFTERFGRRPTLIGANSVSFFGTILAVVSVICALPELLFAARTCSAMMSGISYGSLILFLQETTPTEIRGMTSFLSETTYVGISMMGMSFGMNLVLGQHLPFLIGIHTIAATIVVILVCCLEETPKYLLIKRNDREAALKSLEFYRGATDENLKVMDSIEKEAKEGFAAPFPASISIILRTRHLRQAFLVGFCCMQVMLTIVPISYVSTTFLRAHFSLEMAQLFSFVFASCNFVSSIFGLHAVDRFGRRPMLLFFGFLNVFFLSSYCVFDRLAINVNTQFRYGCVISLLGYGITYGSALGPIAFFITSELVPQHFRSAVQAMVFSVNAIFIFTFSFSTLPLYRWINVWSMIPLFIIPSLMALTYVFFNLPETKGREIHEIVRELAGGHTISPEANRTKDHSMVIENQ